MRGRIAIFAGFAGFLALTLNLAFAQTPSKDKAAPASTVLVEEAQPATLVLASGDKRQVQLIKLTTDEVKFKSKATDANTLGYTAKSGTVRNVQTTKGESFSLNPTTKVFERDPVAKIDPKKTTKDDPAKKAAAAIYGAEVLQGGPDAFADRVKKLQDDLDKIQAVPASADKAGPLEQEFATALGRLKAYRYLVKVPYENLQADKELNKLCQAGINLLEKFGKLDHHPPNPGLPEAEYQFGLKATREGNLVSASVKLSPLVNHVNGWVEDPGEHNRDHLGHRRSSLSPPLMKVGFGRSDRFGILFVEDRSQPRVPDYMISSFPANGLMPISFFGRDHMWHVAFNPVHFKEPDKAIKLQVHEVDNELKKLGSPLPLDYFNATPRYNNNRPFPQAIIFKPGNVALEHGKAYLVEIDGLMKTNGQPASVKYVVVFVKG
jgi:hypothetical protein